MATYTEKLNQLKRLAAEAELGYARALVASAATPIRHKCFVSYHGDDIEAVTSFVEAFGDVFIPRVVGVSDSDSFADPVNSNDESYIKEQIGSKYMSDSTVTILYVGSCTWARKFVDWELSATLRKDTKNKLSGLMAILPPGVSSGKLPGRFADNWAEGNSGYARFYRYPRSAAELRSWIQDAFDARSTRDDLIDNSQLLRKRNDSCP